MRVSLVYVNQTTVKYFYKPSDWLVASSNLNDSRLQSSQNAGAPSPVGCCQPGADSGNLHLPRGDDSWRVERIAEHQVQVVGCMTITG
jgi:hypothetical protein